MIYIQGGKQQSGLISHLAILPERNKEVCVIIPQDSVHVAIRVPRNPVARIRRIVEKAQDRQARAQSDLVIAQGHQTTASIMQKFTFTCWETERESEELEHNYAVGW